MEAEGADLVAWDRAEHTQEQVLGEPDAAPVEPAVGGELGERGLDVRLRRMRPAPLHVIELDPDAAGLLAGLPGRFLGHVHAPSRRGTSARGYSHSMVPGGLEVTS